MSNKPLKASDQRKLEQIVAKKAKSIEFLHQVPPYMYIVSEGTKTEPNYIRSIVDAINKKYNKYTAGKSRIEVEGTGRNTKSLLDYARKMVEERLPEAESVWLMYDKDDFPLDDFDNTSFSIEHRKDKRQYHAIWSNECMELWFVLHFQNMDSNICRKQYYELLDKHFRLLGYGKYEKNLTNIYDIIKSKTEDAIKRAEKQYNNYNNEPPSKRSPATKVYVLIKELMTYL